VFKAIAAEGISVDMIVQNVSHDGSTDLSFTIAKDDLPRLESFVGRVAKDVGAGGSTADDRIAKISLVGAGMRSHPGVAADMFDAMASRGINIEMISTSSIRVSCVIRAEQADDAVRVVHERFELGAKPEEDPQPSAKPSQVSG
jgi:aspartate kinase